MKEINTHLFGDIAVSAFYHPESPNEVILSLYEIAQIFNIPAPIIQEYLNQKGEYIDIFDLPELLLSDKKMHPNLYKFLQESICVNVLNLQKACISDSKNEEF
jgi:hypothetical protein